MPVNPSLRYDALPIHKAQNCPSVLLPSRPRDCIQTKIEVKNKNYNCHSLCDNQALMIVVGLGCGLVRIYKVKNSQ